MASKSNNLTRVYMAVSTVAFTGWVIVVVARLVILAGGFLSQAVSTVVRSIPMVG